MSVDMLRAIIPKDISICLVVQEIARQIDHFTRELVDLSVFSVALKSPLPLYSATVQHNHHQSISPV